MLKASNYASISIYPTPDFTGSCPGYQFYVPVCPAEEEKHYKKDWRSRIGKPVDGAL
jgi:hypothetical protein